MVELTSCSDFQNNVNVCNIIKTSIHLDDVGMIEEHLNLDFSYELLCNLFLVKQFFLYYFKGTNEACIFLLDQVNSTILATPQLLDPDKIVHCDLGILWLATFRPVGETCSFIALKSRLHNLRSFHNIGFVPIEEGRDLKPFWPILKAIFFEEITIFVHSLSKLFSFGCE